MNKLFLFFTIVLATTVSSAEVIERIVAIVNTEIITLGDLKSFKQKINKGGLVDDALLKITDVKTLKTSEKALIKHLINEKIIDSEIKRKNLQITIERVEKEIRNIAKKNGITRDQLKTALKGQGVNFSEYQDFLKSTLERQALIEKEISSKIKISDDEITEYYIKNFGNKDDNKYFEFKLAHILFLSKLHGDDAALNRAEEVYKKLSSGQSFEELSSQYSEDPNFSQGGLLGTFKITEMNKSLAKNVKDLTKGEYTKILSASGNNYQIIKVLKKNLIPNPHLNAKKPKIQAILFETAFKKQLSSWLERKRQEIFVKINI